VVFDPFLVDGDVAFEKVKALVIGKLGDTVAVHVHAVDFPVGGFQDALGQVVTDETVDAEDKDFFHEWTRLKVENLYQGY
jgi:hypothetical protein